MASAKWEAKRQLQIEAEKQKIRAREAARQAQRQRASQRRRESAARWAAMSPQERRSTTLVGSVVSLIVAALIVGVVIAGSHVHPTSTSTPDTNATFTMPDFVGQNLSDVNTNLSD